MNRSVLLPILLFSLASFASMEEEINLEISYADYHIKKLNNEIYGISLSMINYDDDYRRKPANDASSRQRVRSCLTSFCQQERTSKAELAEMNPSQVSHVMTANSLRFIKEKSELIKNVILNCSVGIKSNVFDKIRPQIARSAYAKEVTKDYFKGFDAIFLSWANQCEIRLQQEGVNRKYLADQAFIDSTKGKVLDMYREIFSSRVIDQLRTRSNSIPAYCYYGKFRDDTVKYKIRLQCETLSKSISNEVLNVATINSYVDILQGVKQKISGFDQSTDFLLSSNYSSFPIDSTYPSTGDSNLRDHVLFSNQTCWDKELGEGIVAHEFAHMFSKLFSNLTVRDNYSITNFKSIRKCLNNTYSVRRQPQPILERDPVDELNTEEDFADLFKFRITNSRYPYACDIIDYANRTIPQLERRELLGVYDIIDYSNPHSAPICRFFHEALTRKLELPSQCKTLQKDISSIYNPRLCWPER